MKGVLLVADTERVVLYTPSKVIGYLSALKNEQIILGFSDFGINRNIDFLRDKLRRAGKGYLLQFFFSGNGELEGTPQRPHYFSLDRIINIVDVVADESANLKRITEKFCKEFPMYHPRPYSLLEPDSAA